MLKDEKIGWIGLGKMGRPMAARLAERGFQIHAYDIRPEAAAGLPQLGITWMDSVGKIAEGCTTIIIMVFNGEQVRHLVLGPGGLLAKVRPGTRVVDMTSCDPMAAKDLAGPFTAKGVQYMDAPVSGGVEGAVKGTLTFMVGGDEKLIEKMQEIFQHLGKKTIVMGALGSGYAMKVMNNFLSATTMAATAEVVAVARKAGLSAERVVEVLASSTGTSDASTRKFPNYVFPDKEVGFNVELMHKDIKNYIRFAEN
ncbi:MAG: NAD(P)-dependent oxidoreductase, partial [Deltaproteobacteria bacterium]|nr:NAD(P)-dependent oxidoreductase [Deltaproteobacteria bacterium]